MFRRDRATPAAIMTTMVEMTEYLKTGLTSERERKKTHIDVFVRIRVGFCSSKDELGVLLVAGWQVY